MLNRSSLQWLCSLCYKLPNRTKKQVPLVSLFKPSEIVVVQETGQGSITKWCFNNVFSFYKASLLSFFYVNCHFGSIFFLRTLAGIMYFIRQEIFWTWKASIELLRRLKVRLLKDSNWASEGPSNEKKRNVHRIEERTEEAEESEPFLKCIFHRRVELLSSPSTVYWINGYVVVYDSHKLR